MIVIHDEDGEPYNMCFKPPESADDLVRRQEIQVLQARIQGGRSSGAKFVGIDALHAVTAASRMIDKKLGVSKYTERVEAFREKCKKTDAALAGGVTDVKGDRKLRPSEQKQHRDFYVRVVDESKDGIRVNGCLAHISHATYVNYIIVVPCRAMREEDKEYAVAFAVSPAAEGVTLIHPQRESIEWGAYFDYPLAGYNVGADCMIIFDNVFIPWEHVFLCKEWEYAPLVTYQFANFHRLSGLSNKIGMVTLDVGAALLMAEYNGLEKDPIIRDKLSWLVWYAETVKALGKAAAANPTTDSTTGWLYPDRMMTNCAKFFGADKHHEAMKIIQDIAGGLVATIPSAKDYDNPDTHDMLEKYLAGKEGVPTEYRIRAIKLVKELANIEASVGSIHAEGSLAAQKMTFLHIADLEEYKAAAKWACGIKEAKEHPLYQGIMDRPVFEDIIK
jgi:4-hydroxybutyryl-CoA dehydratase/vinylacetyl-CoA-Delta-isomerase